MEVEAICKERVDAFPWYFGHRGVWYPREILREGSTTRNKGPFIPRRDGVRDLAQKADPMIMSDDVLW
jgi:hypothetical protein